MIELLPPGSILMAGALVLPLLRGRLQRALLVALPLASLAHLLALPDGHSLAWSVLGYELQLVRADGLARVFGLVFHLAAVLSVVFALGVKDTIQHVAALLYAGSAIAAVYAGDLLTLFVFWEATAISSVALIWARRTERAYRSGMRYLIVQSVSGLLLLAGAVVRLAATGSLEFGELGLAGPGGVLLFFAFGIKAAFPLLHNWLQDAYSEATVSGTVFLSAFTTKLAIYALARGFPGTEVLVPLGVTMAAFPIFYAVIENDLRRVLAYSTNNQLGFMVVGVGIGSEMALNGAVAHAFAHILFKALLFMAMGAVLLRVGTIKGSELGGLYKSMPWTTGFCIVGAASISAFPLTSGFVSKSMILTAAADEHRTLTFLILLFASAGVFHHSGIKIPFFAFFAHDRGLRVREAPVSMLLSMGVAAALCLAIGIFPELFYALLPYPVAYVPYTPTHVMTTLQLLVFSALAFALLQKTGIYPPELRSVNVDSDWLYRRLAPRLLVQGGRLLELAKDAGARQLRVFRDDVGRLLRHLYEPPGRLGEPLPIGKTALFAAALLGVYLLLAYL